MTSSLILAVLSVLLLGCARTFPVFAQWYSVTIYAGLKNTIARFSGLFPFSLSEAGLYLLLAFCLYWIPHSLKRPLLLFKSLFSCLAFIFYLYNKLRNQLLQKALFRRGRIF